jgi:DNA helicase-2/ATP-dependent DNA helicase PcrA
MALEFSPNLLAGLTFEQREAVTSHARQMLVRATAGSGKTHVLTLRIQRRIQEGEVSADSVVAMTFTKKAGDELRQRLYRAGIRDVLAGTFHRVANKIVSGYREDHGLRPYTIEPSRHRTLTRVLDQMVADGVAIPDYQRNKIATELDWALAQGFLGASYVSAAKKMRREVPIPLAHFADVIDRYIATCRSRGVLDFDLLLMEATRLLETEPAVLASFRYRYQAIFVDESQDMNPLQFRMLQVMGGEDPDLFCVGDPNQSIYGFNGANPRLIDEILTTWPRTQVLDLTRNHRSTAHIVTVASTLLEDGAAAIEPAKDDGAVPIIRAYDTEADEADAVARWLSANHQNASPWKTMAVLSRTNAQLEVVAAALERHEIPFERRGADYSAIGDLNDSRQLAPERSDAVALSTIHRAKGLEFQHVAAVGWAEGLLPHYGATTADQLAEEQRLAYVALSRAETSLLITWSRETGNPKYPQRAPSRFLGPVSAAVDAIAVRERPASAATIASHVERMKAAARGESL